MTLAQAFTEDPGRTILQAVLPGKAADSYWHRQEEALKITN